MQARLRPLHPFTLDGESGVEHRLEEEADEERVRQPLQTAKGALDQVRAVAALGAALVLQLKAA